MRESKESEPSLVFPVTLVYLLLGALLMAAGGSWWLYQNGQPRTSGGIYYVCAGLLAMGGALIAVGLGIGRMELRSRSGTRKP